MKMKTYKKAWAKEYKDTKNSQVFTCGSDAIRIQIGRPLMLVS